MPGPPETPETFRQHLPTLVAASVGTVLAAVLGSYLGTAGTVFGLAAGSAVSGTATWFGDRALRRSAQLAKAKRQAALKKRRPLTATETTVIEAAARQSPWFPRGTVPWRRVALVSALALAIAAGSVTAAEAVLGRPVSDVVQHKAGTGFTFGGGAPAETATVTPAATATASPSAPSSSAAAGPTASATASATAPASPSATAPASPSFSPAPVPSPDLIPSEGGSP
jgi:hypothetical protein